MKIRAIYAGQVRLQAHPDGKPRTTSTGYIAIAASVQDVPSLMVIVSFILPTFSKNVNLDEGMLAG